MTTRVFRFARSSALPSRLALVLLTAAVPATAAVYTAGPGAIAIHYQGGQLTASWDLATGAIVDNTTLAAPASYAPGALVVFTGHPFTPRPFGAGYDPLGVPVGTPIWDIPQSLTAGEPQIAFGADTLTPGDWSGFTASLIGLNGPAGGEFSLYTANSPNPLLFFATSDGIGAGDSLPLVLGGHSHHTFAFTQPGVYQATVQWQGLHVVDGLKSAQATLTFAVVAIPEPATFAVWLAAGALLAIGLRRRAR